MKIAELKTYKKILILGYGVEGKVTESFLKKHVPEAEIVIADQKTDPNYLDSQHDADLVIKSPGIPPRLVTQKYTTATNIFFANIASQKTIGITGTKGKSTVSALVQHILQLSGLNSKLLGNIGQPMLSVFLESNEANCWYILELSSYQLVDAQYSPHIAAILNIFDEHQDYHLNFESYLQAKSNIVAFSNDQDFYVYSDKFIDLVNLSQKTKAKSVPFIEDLSFKIDNPTLLGSHNQDNIRAATRIAKLLNINDSQIESAVKTFPGLPFRLQPVGEFEGIRFINDSASTNPQSTIAALDTIDSVDTLIVGGMDRGYDVKALCQKIIEKKPRSLILFPDTDEKILKGLLDQSQFNIFKTSKMAEAVKHAFEKTEKGQVCLLSPGAPSYNLFDNFVARGEEFNQQIKAYASQNQDN